MMRHFLSTILCIFAIAAYAQSGKVQQCIAGRPKVINQDLIKLSEIKAFVKKGDWGQNNKTNNYWNVYSDRENNTAYNGPSTNSGRCSTLEFNEAVRIAKIEGNFALVYRENRTAAVYPAINEPVWKGWVPMENLLLWGSCPTNDIGIYNKALPVINIDKYIANGKRNDIGSMYKNPETKTGRNEFRSSMDFYFVMKESNGLVLLAKQCKMSGYTNKVLYGWVNPESYIAWNERACLEPNWKDEIVERLKGMELKVFRDTELGKEASTIPLGRSNDYGSAATKYRMYADEMRYPLLDNESKKKDLYKVTAFSTSGGTITHIPSRDKAGVEIEKAIKDMSVINLIMVIDGTSSMKDFYEPARVIIQKANQYFSTADAKKTVRVGVVIYRDYPDGDAVAEYMPMCSPTDAGLANFLKTGGKYGIRSVATSATEALYNGLSLALDAKKMGYSSRNSNLMFIIGDCGNDLEDNRISDEHLIKKIRENRINVSAFQVYNGTSQAYKLFSAQTGDIVRTSLDRFYGDASIAKWREVPNGYEYVVKTSSDVNKFYIGNVRYAPNGQKMPVSTLYDLVKDSYIQFKNAIDVQIAKIINHEDIFNGMIADESITERTAAAKINQRFIEEVFSPKTLQIIKQQSMLMAYEGYTQKTDPSSGSDLWQPVVYISQDEFNALMEKLQPVMAAANEGSEDRRPYVEAMKALIRTMVPDITEAEINSKSTKEIMALVAGLPVGPSALSGHTLMQIQDKQTVKQDEFDGLISKFRTKYQKLDRIKTGAYKFSIEHNGTRWYWLPVEDLP